MLIVKYPIKSYWVSVFLCVVKDLANSWTEMFFLFIETSHWSWKGL